MSSSDRRIAAARKIDPIDPDADQSVPRPRDTWPAPPPSSGSSADDTDEHDTIPTPPPESGTSDVVVVPPLRRVNVVAS